MPRPRMWPSQTPLIGPNDPSMIPMQMPSYPYEPGHPSMIPMPPSPKAPFFGPNDPSMIPMLAQNPTIGPNDPSMISMPPSPQLAGPYNPEYADPMTGVPFNRGMYPMQDMGMFPMNTPRDMQDPTAAADPLGLGAAAGGKVAPGLSTGYPRPDLSQFNDIQAKLQAAQAQAGEQGEADLGMLRERLINELGRSPTMDLSPLMALTDTWTGGNISKGYQNPYSAGTQQNAVNTMTAQMQRQQGALNETDLANLRAQLNTAMQAENLRYRGETGAKQYELEMAKLKAELEKDKKLGGLEDQRIFSQQQQFTKMKPVEFMQAVPDFLKKLDDFQKAYQNADGNMYDANVKQAFSAAATSYNRDVAQLGALAGADLSLISSAIGYDPVTGKIKDDAQAIFSNWMRGQGGVDKAVGQLKGQLFNQVKGMENSLNPLVEGRPHLQKLYEPLKNNIYNAAGVGKEEDPIVKAYNEGKLSPQQIEAAKAAGRL